MVDDHKCSENAIETFVARGLAARCVPQKNACKFTSLLGLSISTRLSRMLLNACIGFTRDVDEEPNCKREQRDNAADIRQRRCITCADNECTGTAAMPYAR